MDDRDGKANLGEARNEFTFRSAAERSFFAGIGLLLFGIIGLVSGIKGIISGGVYESFLVICALFLLVGSVWAFRHAKSLKSIRVRLYERGFLVDVGEQTYCFAWDQIANVDETIVEKGRTTPWHILITRQDGESFGFMEYELDAAGELRDAIKEGTAACGIPWTTEQQA